MSWQELPLDRVYFDSVTGVPGTTWPIGTPSVPSDVIADVIAICAARRLKVIDVSGALTLGAAMAHYDFIGHRHEDVAEDVWDGLQERGREACCHCASRVPVGMDVTVDPYSLSLNGQVRIVVQMLTDVGIRHAESFSVSVDAGNQ